jgi:hypothetical protein
MDTPQTEQIVPGVPMVRPDQFARIPGLFQRIELSQVVKPGLDFYVESTDKLTDGTPLYAVYSRQSKGRRAPV